MAFIVKTACGSADRADSLCWRRPCSSTAASIAITWYTSAARSLKIPFNPQYDAIASIRRAMRSKSGPAVSDRS